jgi:hypothetical protein
MAEILSKLAIYLGVLGILIFISDFIWTIIHEFAHLVAAKLTCGTRRWKMRVWPHKLNGESVAGSVAYTPLRPETNRGRGVVFIASFIPSIVACIILPIAIFTGSIPFIALMIAGWSDQVSGSLPASNTADLPVAARELKVSPILLRICGLSIAVASLVVSTPIAIEALVQWIKNTI